MTCTGWTNCRHFLPIHLAAAALLVCEAASTRHMLYVDDDEVPKMYCGMSRATHPIGNKKHRRRTNATHWIHFFTANSFHFYFLRVTTTFIWLWEVLSTAMKCIKLYWWKCMCIEEPLCSFSVPSLYFPILCVFSELDLVEPHTFPPTHHHPSIYVEANGGGWRAQPAAIEGRVVREMKCFSVVLLLVVLKVNILFYVFNEMCVVMI